MAAAEIDWAERAGVAEQAILRRHLRRLGGVLPGTRIGRIRWPRRLPVSPFPWHYWWQAHLLDCLVDAQLRAPDPRRARHDRACSPAASGCTTAGSWVNRYYDDIAWLGLAVQRAGTLARRSGPSALGAITTRLDEGWTEDGGGGIWWRRNDDFKNAPANGPAAILLARSGQLGFAAAIADWMAEALLDPDTGLVRDGVRLAPDGSVREVVTADLHLLPGRAPGHLRRARRAGRAPALGRPRGGHRRRDHPPAGRPGRRAARQRRRRRRAVRRDHRALPGRRRGAPAGADRGRVPAGAGQRGRRLGRAGRDRRRPGVLRRLGQAGDRARPAASRRPTCRCSSAPGCCSRRPPGSSAPR